MKIHIKTLTGAFRTLDVEYTNTIEEVKQKLQDIEGIPIEQQKLVHCSKVLENDKTLDDYNIGKDSIIQLVLQLRGGGSSFEFSKLEEAQIMDFDDNAPDYTIVKSGLNLEGFCINNVCEAGGRLVVAPLGFISFNMKNPQQLNLCVCPLCKKTFAPITCLFTDCYYKTEGCDTNGTFKNIDWTKAPVEKYIEYRGNNEEERMYWSSLTLTAVPLSSRFSTKLEN